MTPNAIPDSTCTWPGLTTTFVDWWKHWRTSVPTDSNCRQWPQSDALAAAGASIESFIIMLMSTAFEFMYSFHTSKDCLRRVDHLLLVECGIPKYPDCIHPVLSSPFWLSVIGTHTKAAAGFCDENIFAEWGGFRKLFWNSVSTVCSAPVRPFQMDSPLYYMSVHFAFIIYDFWLCYLTAFGFSSSDSILQSPI